MTDEASRPLLGGQARSSSATPSEERQPRRSFELSSESTPLLHRREDDLTNYGTEEPSPAASRRSTSTGDGAGKKPSRVRWPTIISLALLTMGVLAILIFAFATPAVVKEYAQEAAVFKPTALSIDSTTPDGVRARVQGDFVMDASRVKNPSIRRLGRFATWIAREVETGESNVDVYLPEYGNVLVGIAELPSIKVNIRNGHENHLDFLADLAAGDVKGIHAIAMDWIEGRLARLSIRGKATLHLTTGLISLGKQIITDTITFEENDFPALPVISLTRLNVHDTENGAMAVDVSLTAKIDSPIALTIPPLGFDVLVPNCSPGDPHILVANAATAEVAVHAYAPTNISATGLIRRIPDELTTSCPGVKDSPLDLLVSGFVQGQETTIFVRGAEAPISQTPGWIVDLLRSVTIPLPFTGHALDDLVKNFTMTDTHFSLPDPFADPNTPEGQPSVSAIMKVLIGLPEEMNFQVDVPRVRAIANVYYRGDQLGVLDINKWHDSNSTITEDEDGLAALLVEFAIKDAPLEVTDSDVLSEVVQEMLFGGKTVVLHVAATVDTKVSTGLGQLTVRGIPASGDVPVNTPTNNPLDDLNPQVVSLSLNNSTESSLSASVEVNFTNPTKYSATIPFVDFLMLYNGTSVAHITARNIAVHPGNNTRIPVEFAWNPFGMNGTNGVKAGQTLISSYISGYNTSVSIQAHEGSIPALPELGKALSAIPLNISIPQLSTPGSPKDGKESHFIQDATLHLWTSTADFTLFSPLNETSITITSIEATALYEKDEPIGRINYHQHFDVPPGISQTPRIPVDLILGGVGYDALRKALGQSLEMDVEAKIGIKVMHYTEVVLYRGKGIAANIRI